MSLIPNVGRKRLRYRLLLFGIGSFLWLGVGLHLFPVYWGFITSIKTVAEIYSIPPTIFVRNPTLDIWKMIITYKPEAWLAPTVGPLIALKNSFIITLGAMALQIPFTALVAYALSKLESPKWGRIMFLFFIGTMLVPGQISLIPRYLLMRSFPFIGATVPKIPFTNTLFPSVNFLDTYWAVILPAAYAGFNVLLFKGFFDTIPDTLLNAARLDGANEFRIFTRIVLPLSKPVFAVVSYFSFIAIWNQFMWPLIVFAKKTMHPFAVSMYIIERDISTRFGGASADLQQAGYEMSRPQEGGIIVGHNLIMVMGIIQAIPLFIMFLICREYLMKGIKLRGFK